MRRTRLGVLFAAAVLVSYTHNPPPEPVNLVLISIDSLCADHVHGYGYNRETTPTLDRLASEGTLFENVVAASSWTLLSIMMGGVQDLPNGNVLITESTKGHAFEVTRDGTIVWEFYNPDVNEVRDKRASIYRMRQIPFDFLEPGLLPPAPAPSR